MPHPSSPPSEPAPPPSGGDDAVERVLEHLARTHPLVVLCDESDRLEWVHDAHGALAAGDCAGATIGDLLRERVSRLAIERFPVRARPGASVVVGLEPGEARDRAARASDRAELLPSILDAFPDPAIASDPFGFVSYANSAAGQLLDRPVAELVGRPLLSCLPANRSLADVLDAVAAGNADGLELTIDGARGPRWVSISSRPLNAPTGGCIGQVVFLRDVHDRRMAELALDAKSEELESYVSHVAHDLRAPLTSVLGFARLLRDDFAGALGEEGLRFLGRIEQAGTTMEALISDLLDLSRIGRVDEPETLVDPKAVIQQVLSDHKAAIDALDAEIEYPTHPPMLRCNRTRAYQLLSNLIGNALHHMGPVDAPRIEIGVDESDGMTHLRVRDNGAGIPASDHERIFELFHSGARRDDGRRSTGLGLAIVRRIATRHGGRAWVESPPGEGATFHVTLRAH